MDEGDSPPASALSEDIPETPDPELPKVTIVSAKFYREDAGFLEENVIELTVRNGADRAIRRIYLHGVLQSPGRALPWSEDDFNYDIPGGLERGETQTWSLNPGFGSAFRSTRPRDEAEFRVSVAKIEWAQ